MGGRNKRKGMSLTYKLTLIILVLILFPTLLMAFSSVNTFNTLEDSFLTVLEENIQTTRDDKVDKYSKILGSVERESDITASYIERNWEQLNGEQFNPVFEGMVWAGPMNDGEKRDEYREQVNRLSHIGVLLEHMDRGNELTSLTYFGTKDNNVATSKNITSALNQIPSGFSNVKRPWYMRVNETRETSWTNTYVDANTKELVTTVASPVRLENGELFGVVGFDVTLGVLSNDILETDPGFAFLLDSNGEAIVYPGMKAPNKTVYAERTFNGTNLLEDDDVPADLKGLAEEMVAGETGMREVTIEGKQSFVAYGPIEENDWSVGVAVPVEETTKTVTQTFETTIYRYLLLFLLIIFIVAGIGIYVSNQITEPIIELHEKAESISKGGIGKEVNIRTGDEIEELADSFNRIIRTVKILQRRDAPNADV